MEQSQSTPRSPLVVPDMYVDLSGVSSSSTENPYDALLKVCNNDPVQIQLRYKTHRQNRNVQQKVKLLAADFTGLTIDPILYQTIHPDRYPGFTDPRHNLTFWARPPKPLRQLIMKIQENLVEKAPNLWLMPLDCLHMTVLEMTHSGTESEIEELVNVLRPKVQDIVDYTFDHHARLVKPIVGYDAAALALTFLPAAGDGRPNPNDSYTYHHLRRDLYDLCKATGVKIASRYTIPSAHVTLARFVDPKDFSHNDRAEDVADPEKMREWVEHLEGINGWLQETYWPNDEGVIAEGGEWIVGQEKGLDFRKGICWYGGGETVSLGKGF